MHELGQSLFGLHQTYDPAAQSHGEEENIAPAAGTLRSSSGLPSIKAISNVFASLSAINKVKHDENHSKVGTPIEQLEWSIKAARLAVRKRKNCQLTYTTYVQQSKNREAGVDKLIKSADLNPQSGTNDEKIATAQELRKLYVSHAKVQVDYSQQMDSEWKKLAGAPGGGGGNGARGGPGAGAGGAGGSTEAETLMI